MEAEVEGERRGGGGGGVGAVLEGSEKAGDLEVGKAEIREERNVVQDHEGGGGVGLVRQPLRQQGREDVEERPEGRRVLGKERRARVGRKRGRLGQR